ncbi:MAG: hypothetical protein QM640_17485 [Niabella sp.]
MENFDGKHIPEEAGDVCKAIADTAKSARIAALVSLAGILMGTIAAFVNPASQPVITNKEGFDNASIQFANSTTYIPVFFSFLIGILAFYFLYRFATLAKAALQNNDSVKLQVALRSLAGYFKTWGIIIFLMASFMMLAVIANIAGGTMGM